jgi:hypothetical protein
MNKCAKEIEKYIESVNLNIYYEKLEECKKCPLFYLDCRGPTPIDIRCPSSKKYGFENLKFKT